MIEQHKAPSVIGEIDEKPFRCECGNTTPIHHHCGIKGWNPLKDEPCPACAALWGGKK